MFIIHRIKCSVLRNLGRSGLFILASFLLICFLSAYFNGLWSNESLLVSMGKQIPVTAAIASPDGSQEFGLSIPTKNVDGFLNLGVSDPVVTAESYGNIDREKMRSGSGIISLYLIGTNSIDAFTLSQGDITADEPLTFLAGDEPKCIINSKYITRNDLRIKPGSVVDINLFRAEYDASGSAFEFVAVAPVQLTVVGFYSSEFSSIVDADNVMPDLICPVKWLRQQYEAANAQFQYSSAKGNIAEPLLLNDFKAKVEKLNFRQVNPQAGFSRTGNALLISDKVFIEATSQIMRNIQTLRSFLGPFILLVFLLVTLISFFISRSRRDEIFLSRCLGMKKVSILFDLIVENCLLALIGGILAAVILFLTSSIHLSVYLPIFLVFMSCVLAGSLTSALILTQANMMRLLSRAD